MCSGRVWKKKRNMCWVGFGKKEKRRRRRDGGDLRAKMSSRVCKKEGKKKG